MKERYNYIDYSKAFAILLVITGHICLFCINRGDVNNADNMKIYSWLTVFQMPLFFFLSGIVIKHKGYSIKETIKNLYKKTRQLLVPFFLFGTIFTLFIHQDFCEFITPVMKQGYWYLLVLFELYLIYYFFNPISLLCKSKMFSFVVDLIFIVLLYSMLQLLNKGVDLNSSCWQNYLSLIQVKRYAPFFFVAIFLRKYGAVNTLFNNKYIMSASLLIAVITELLKCFNFNIHAIGYWLLWIYIVLSISVIMKLEVIDNKMTQLLSFIGVHTLDVYVLHFFIVRSISMAFLCSYFNNYNYLILELLIISPISILIAVISVYIGRVIRANKRIESFIFFR